MKIKPTPTQIQKLKEAHDREVSLQEQAETAVRLVNSARKQRQDIFEMILDAHGIDKKTISPKATINLDDKGYLILGEVAAGDRIRKAIVKKPLKKKSHAKA